MFFLYVCAMMSVRRAMAWLSRLRHRVGFGVHSPWAFRFIRDVVGERLPYYAYADLQGQAPISGKRELRLARLYLRLSNFMQAAAAIDYAAPTPAYAMYIAAGCRRTRVTSADGSPAGTAAAIAAIGGARLARMSAVGQYERFFDAWRAAAADTSMLVIEGIDSSRDARRLWRRMKDDGACTLTFDLYYCGIVYKDSRRAKQHYIVDF